MLSLLVALPLAGCGFRPVYGPGGSASGLRNQFEFQAPDDLNSFNLVGRLEERLGQPRAPRYLLGYRIALDTSALAISGSNNIERYNVIGQLDYSVTERGGKAAVATGQVENFTSYSTTASPVGTRAAERDAYARLMISLADLLVTRLLATAPGWAPARGTPAGVGPAPVQKPLRRQ